MNVPSGVVVHDNQFCTYVPAQPNVRYLGQGDDAPVTFSNVQDSSFRDNDLRSFADVIISNGVRFDSSAAVSAPAAGWDVTGNRFGGNLANDPADISEVFTSAIMIRPGGSGAEDITINLNTFEHCANQIFWTGDSANAYRAIPMAMGTTATESPSL